MLPSSGYFKNIPCPYFASGFCTRPHCHYQHASKVNYKPTPIVKSIPEYKPTPINELKKLKTSSDPSNDDSVKGIENLTDKVSLKKVETSSKHSVAAKKLKSETSDDKTSKTKSQLIAEKEEELRKKKLSNGLTCISTKANPIKTPNGLTKTLNAYKYDVRTKHDSLGKSPDRSLPSSSNEAAGKTIDHLVDILETPPSDSELEAISVVKKPRVAHKSTVEKPSNPTNLMKPKTNPSQAMFNRFRSNAAVATSSSPLLNDDEEPSVKKRVAHNTKSISPTSLNDTRKVSSPVRSTKKRPVIPTDFSSKVPLSLRTKYLNFIIDELLKYCSEDDAYSRGLSEEKLINSRSQTKNVYINLAANTIKRIRNEANIKSPNSAQIESTKLAIANRKVSHQKILDGPHAENCSIERKGRFLTIEDLTEIQLYKAFKRYLMTPEQLKEYGYPLPDPNDDQGSILPPSDPKKKNDFNSRRRICVRCVKQFIVDEHGYPQELEACVYHSGRLWAERFNRSVERRYSCCKGDPSSGGCCSGKSHVVDGCFHPLFNKGYVQSQHIGDKSPESFFGIYSVDCEMCYTTVGLELTRVSVIDHKMKCVYETLVKPTNPVLDYNTKFSGIKDGDLDNIDTTLKDVQKKLLSLIDSRTILIGHSLDSDLKALKLIHNTVIDTAAVFPHRRGLPYKRALRTLMAECLQSIIQNEEDGHDSQEDARACMKLMLWKVSQDIKVIRI